MQLDQLVKQVRELWKRLSMAQRLALVAVLATVLSGGLAAALYEPPMSWAPLFSNLQEDQAGPVVDELVATKVPHRLTTVDGQVTILVPAEQVSKLRIGLASKDLPTGKGGLAHFGEGAYGMPEEVGYVKWIFALSQELTQTIRGLDAVRDARVHLVVPKRSLFKSDAPSPSASVSVHLRPGHTLSQDEVRGIVNLVAHAVEGLTPTTVTLVDKSGKELWAGGDDGHTSMRQRELEQERREKIEALLERILGPNQFEVVVTAEFERGKVRRSEERHDNSNKVVTSEQIREERRGLGVVVRDGIATAPGVASPPAAAANAAETPGAAAPAATSSGLPGTTHVTRNYVPNVVRIDTEQADVRLSRLYVAVLLNAPEPVVYTSTSAATSSRGLALDGVMLGRGKRTPDLGALASMIRSAGGVDIARGDTLELSAMPFYVDPESLPQAEPLQAPLPPPWYELMPLWAYALASASLLMIVLAGLMAVVRARRRAAEEEADLVSFPTRADELAAVLEGAEYEPAPTLAELRVKVHELIGTNGDLAAEILAAWIDDQHSDEETEGKAA
jgi:flagellar M-ring protein FliF